MTIHYHGTPITPNRVLIEEMTGAHFCVSHMAPAQVKLCHDIGQSVMLDNGAFSAWKSGKATNWPAYYAWCDKWLDCPTTWAVIPDVVAGGADEQDALLQQWPFGFRGAPVYHMHEPVSRFVALTETWPRVCIGSSGAYADVMAQAWQRRMDELWRALGNMRTPNVHMLRGLQLVRERWPFASVDSTDIARNHHCARNTAAKMRARWDAGQCPPRFICPGEQLELAA